jgi:hypothetical protein
MREEADDLSAHDDVDRELDAVVQVRLVSA